MPMGYLVSGALEAEQSKTIIEARAQVGGNFLAGDIDESDPDSEIDKLANTLEYACSTNTPARKFLRRGLKSSATLSGLWGHDELTISSQKHGMYDFPRKKGTILKCTPSACF